MAVRNVGDRSSYQADDDFGPDMQGYCLTFGDDGTNHVKKAVDDDPFLGVVFRSTELPGDAGAGAVDRDNLAEGAPVAVEHDGWVNVLCQEGIEYEPGDEVYLHATEPGLAVHVDDGDGSDVGSTRVGTVMRYRDTTEDDAAQWVVVSITGAV